MYDLLVGEKADPGSPVFSFQFLREWKVAPFLLCVEESKGGRIPILHVRESCLIATILLKKRASTAETP